MKFTLLIPIVIIIHIRLILFELSNHRYLTISEVHSRHLHIRVKIAVAIAIFLAT